MHGLSSFVITARAAGETVVVNEYNQQTQEFTEHTLNNVGTTASLMDQYGPTIVILSLFLVIFIALIFFVMFMNRRINEQMIAEQKRTNEANQAMTKEMFNTCMQLVKSVGQIQDKQNEKKKNDDEDSGPSHKKKKLITSYIDSSLAFKDASRIAMSKIRCDRIAIYLLHNGNHTPYGYPFTKMSCVHEWSIHGLAQVTSTRRWNHTHMPLYAFSNIIEALVHDGEYVINNVCDTMIIDADDQIYQFIAGASVKALFFLAIRDAEGDLAAFTVAEFKDEKDFAESIQYNTVKSALQTMNDNIVSIVVNKSFRNSYTTHPSEEAEYEDEEDA